MSHVAVRIVANWLKDATYGVNAVATSVPRDGTDPAPPAVHVYDETRDGWVARNQVPKPNTKVVFPAVIVFLQSARSDGGVADTSESARFVDGTVQLAVQLLMDQSTTETASTAGMYLMRALTNSLLQLNEGEQEAARTLLGVRLMPSQSVAQGQLEAPVSDSVISVGALVVTYPTTEVTAPTLPS